MSDLVAWLDRFGLENLGSQWWRRNLFRCLACRAVLRKGVDAYTCSCGKSYPVLANVPILLPEVKTSPASAPLTEVETTQVITAFGIKDEASTRQRIAAITARTYQFTDSFLEAENNYLLQRLAINREARLSVEALAEPGTGAAAFSIIRHYVPATLVCGAATSHNVRIRNIGSEPLLRRARDGWSLALRLGGQEADPTPLPVTVLPGREITLPVRLSAPTAPGDYELTIALVHADGRCVLASERFPIAVQSTVKRSYRVLDPIRGPLPADYDADHRIGIQLVERAVNLARARRGLEIATSASPATCNLGCLTVNIDIDAQTMQMADVVFEKRGYSNVIFACCDALHLPFAEATFDFVSTFAALHHFADPVSVLREAVRVVKPGGFVAIMCEPTGHEFDRPHPQIVEVLEHGVNEQIFSLDEYARMFHAVGLRPTSSQMDDDSLKVILRR